MPSNLALSTIDDYRKAAFDAVQGKRTSTVNRRDGSVFDLFFGTSATVFSREEQHLRDLFRAVYDDTALGDDLSNRLFAKTGIARYRDTYGQGAATLIRPTTAAGAGTIWEGSRIRVVGASIGGAGYYRVTRDIPVGATQTGVPNAAIEATVYGPGTAVSTASGAVATVDDPLWDTTWTVPQLQCAGGTFYEKAKDYLARVRQTQLDSRAGYVRSMVKACQNVGAATIAMFSSQYGGGELGMNAIYVADAAFSGDAQLVRDVITILERWRVLGATTYVGLMTRADLKIQGTVYLTDNPGKFDLVSLAVSMANACARGFATSSDGFTFSVSQMAGAIAKSVPGAAQSVVLSVPSADVTVLVNGSFPATLTRYVVTPADVELTFAPPT